MVSNNDKSELRSTFGAKPENMAKLLGIGSERFKDVVKDAEVIARVGSERIAEIRQELADGKYNVVKGAGYEVKPKLRGKDTLVVWYDSRGKRDTTSARSEKIGEFIENTTRNHWSIQRIYKNMKRDAIPVGLTHLSDEYLDGMILQKVGPKSK